MDIVGEIDGWKILSDHESAFVRAFVAEPMVLGFDHREAEKSYC